MHRMRTRTAAVLLAAPLALMGCSDGDDAADVDVNTPEVDAPDVDAPDVDVDVESEG
jgi:PBP1b-binding outer membrane lipoprotein LpoB